jgi:hypothetical protein
MKSLPENELLPMTAILRFCDTRTRSVDEVIKLLYTLATIADANAFYGCHP